MPDIPLLGCTPEPLMNYLKALGILRIVAEQKDKTAKGCWKDGIFYLRSELDREGLVRFFLENYKPTPVFAPWNGDGGFITDSGKSAERIYRIKESNLLQTATLKEAIENIETVKVLEEFKIAREEEKELKKKKEEAKKENRTLSEEDNEHLKNTTKKVKEMKETILYKIRGYFPDNVVGWLDTCMTLNKDGFQTSPLLGTGGCDGRLEFSTNYLGNILTFLETNVNQRSGWIKNSIYADSNIEIISSSIGQFAPGLMGGPNATQGMEGNSLINPFDFILMIEGSILFAGSVSRKYNSYNSSKSSFPFTVYASSIGLNYSEDKEIKDSHGEIWLPVWSRYVSLFEIKYVISEGRTELSNKQALSGIDVSRAIASLGIDRGIDSFFRYSFLKRSGKAYLSIPIGQFNVRARPDVDLIREIDKWLDNFRRAISDKNAPPRFKSALRRIETAIFEYCQFGENHRFQEILCALGQAEKELALTEGKVGKDQIVSPIFGLSPDWIKASNDNSVEFEIALALASIWDKEIKIGPIRANLEPVTWKGHPEWKGYVSWCKKSKSVSWNNADLKENLTAVLERRILDGNRSNCSTPPLSYSRGVSIEALSRFISGDVDNNRIAELLWGMMLIDHWKKYPEISYPSYESLPIPRAFALLKILYLPYDIEKNGKNTHIRTEERILPLLRSNRPGEACAIAARRLRNSGILSMPHARNSNMDHEWTEAMEGLDSRRIAAALLIPAHYNTINRLMKLVARPDKELLEVKVKEIERRY